MTLATSGQATLLLTGGRGFVGRSLAPRLVDLFPRARRIMAIQGAEAAPVGWETAPIDLADEAAVDRLVAWARPTIVVHLAAQASVGQLAQAAEATWRVNVLGVLGLAGAIARHAPAGVFLFTSTAEVYGASFLAGPAREETPTAPVNAYAVSKLAAEYILQDILPPATRLIIARAFNHSGPGQDDRFVLPSFAAQIVRAEAGSAPAVIRVGNLDAERDFLHVADVVEAYVALLAAPSEGPRLTRVNVASGEAWRLGALLDDLLARARRPITVEVDPARMRPADIPRVIGDASRLRALTGWRPRLGVDAILDDLLSYFRAREAEP